MLEKYKKLLANLVHIPAGVLPFVHLQCKAYISILGL